MSKNRPKAYRDEQNPDIYRDPANLGKLEPDRVPPVVQGYFRIPAVWIGEEPETGSKSFNHSSFSAVVVHKKLACGIFAFALRDGTFMFDFTNSKFAPVTVVPGFSYPDAPKPWTIPPENSEQYWLAEKRAILRSRLLNVHQLFLSDAERSVDKTSAAIGYPISPWNMIEGISRHVIHRNREISDRMRELSGRVLNMHYEVERPEMFNRRVLSKACVERSFELVDELALRDDEPLVTILEEAYKISWHNLEGRFGESINSGWTACEQIISKLWLMNLHDHGITGARKKKLLGVDYTVSQKIEFLSMAGVISDEEYSNLEVARKARNKWAHEAKHPKREAIQKVSHVLQALIERQFGFKVSLSSVMYSGTASFPYWTFEKYRARD